MHNISDKKQQEYPQGHRQTTSLRSLPKIETLLPKITDLSMTKLSAGQNNQFSKKKHAPCQNSLDLANPPLDVRANRGGGGFKNHSRISSSYVNDYVEETKQDDAHLLSLSQYHNISAGNGKNHGGLVDILSPLIVKQKTNKIIIPTGQISSFSASPLPGSATNNLALFGKDNIKYQLNPGGMVTSTLARTKLAGSPLLKESQPASSIAQLQLDADQNRLDFMLEKGLNFERTSQLSKLQQENKEQRQIIKKSEAEMKRLKSEIDYLKSVIQQLETQNLQANYLQPYNGNNTLEDQYMIMEKKMQQNEYFKQQLIGLKSAFDKENQELRQKYKELELELQMEKVKNQQKCNQIQQEQQEEQEERYELEDNNSTNEQNVVLITDLAEQGNSKIKEKHHENNNQEQEHQQQICSRCKGQGEQLIAQNKILQEELAISRKQCATLESETSQLRENLELTKDSATNEKQLYEKYIKEQSEEILRADQSSREFRILYEQLMEKIKQLKNSNEFQKITMRNEYSIIKTDDLSQMDRASRENAQKINDLNQQKTNLENQISVQVVQIKTLTDQISSLNMHIDWLKKRGGGTGSTSNGALTNYIGLSEEILKLKNAIDEKITVIPDNDKHISEFASKLEEMEKLNGQMVKQINQLASEEENSRKMIQSIPVLKQFEQAQVKVEQYIKCAACEGVLEEAITCVPCGHNFCKKCHYESKQKGKGQETVACRKCGPSTMIYANESLDELIEMFGLMKRVKEVMKLYLRQQQ